MKIEIVRDYMQEVNDIQRERNQKVVIRAVALGIITPKGGAELIKELWNNTND